MDDEDVVCNDKIAEGRRTDVQILVNFEDDLDANDKAQPVAPFDHID